MKVGRRNVDDRTHGFGEIRMKSMISQSIAALRSWSHELDRHHNDHLVHRSPERRHMGVVPGAHEVRVFYADSLCNSRTNIPKFAAHADVQWKNGLNSPLGVLLGYDGHGRLSIEYSSGVVKTYGQRGKFDWNLTPTTYLRQFASCLDLLSSHL